MNGDRPRLYHAPSSYYSMIARLALTEGGIGYDRIFVDIHWRMGQQRPDYVRLNPNMTVPTLVLPARVLDESRAIAEFALGTEEGALNAETRRWLDLHYSYPIEELTFGEILNRRPLARIMIPRRLAAIQRRLLKLAAANPDLAALYEARAAVFAERVRLFDPEKIRSLWVRRRAEALGFLDQLAGNLADGRGFLVPPHYGAADVVWTVFLARIEFALLGGEIANRPALARYWRALRARPSFAAADIWTEFHRRRWIAGLLGLIRN